MNTTPNTQKTSDKLPLDTKPMGEASSNRDQLRRRVEARVQDLEASLSSLKSQEGNVERCRALETDLRLAQDCMAGGWDKVGEIEAAKLTQWLDSTQSMTDGSVPKGATVPGQVENAIEDGRTTVESSPPANSKPHKMAQA
jgi:hypothetical protein